MYNTLVELYPLAFPQFPTMKDAQKLIYINISNPRRWFFKKYSPKWTEVIYLMFIFYRKFGYIEEEMKLINNNCYTTKKYMLEAFEKKNIYPDELIFDFYNLLEASNNNDDIPEQFIKNYLTRSPKR